MSIARKTILATAVLALGAAPALAQQPASPATEAAPAGSDAAAEAEAARLQPEIVVQNYRPQDKRGLNIFEAPKSDGVPFEGFKLQIGGSFTTQFQSIGHSNTADAVMMKDAAGKDYDANRLAEIGWGFNLPTANLTLNAQLARGIRVNLETYLSSRHHQESWVKGGYLLMDASPIDHPVLDAVMDVVTLKAGMFPLNYGDAHFRRTDNGNAMHNPFVGNLILDAWTFEPGAEIYARKNGFLAMVGVTSGTNKGDVTNPDARGPAFLGKLGYDRQLSGALRVRLTGSYYTTDKTPSATLYYGDRTGSRYYSVMENTVATTNGNFWSGSVNPAFSSEIEAFQINPFVKLGGLEVFGVIEKARGKSASETELREIRQYAGDVVYRFLADERLYVGGRVNRFSGELGGIPNEVGVDRTALSAGWFVTPTVLLKGEYVSQKYDDFPSTDIRNGGTFDGIVVEGVVSF